MITDLYPPTLAFKDLKTSLLLQMHRHQAKATWIMKNQANVTPAKETIVIKLQEPNPKKWRYVLHYKDLKITILKKHVV